MQASGVESTWEGDMSDDYKQRIMASLDKYYTKNDPTYKPKKAKEKKKREPTAVPTEHQEQVRLVGWMRKRGWTFCAVPNGGSRLDTLQGCGWQVQVCRGSDAAIEWLEEITNEKA